MQMNRRYGTTLMALLWLGLCASGCVGMRVAEADKLHKAGKIAEAAAIYEEACAQWHVEGCRDLAYVLRNDTDRGVKPDGKKLRWAANRACFKGDADGCLHLGYAYQYGVGGEVNLDNAQLLYGRLCDASVWNGCVLAGRLYLSRDTSPASAKTAARLLSRACDGGSSWGCSELGWTLYHHGGGRLKAEPRRALSLLRATCKGEVFDGCSHLARALMEGKQGYPKDHAQGVTLLKKMCFERRKAYDCWTLSDKADASGKPVTKASQLELIERACVLGERRACASFESLRMDLASPQSKRAVAADSLKKCQRLGDHSAVTLRCKADAHSLLGEPAKALPLYRRACTLGDGRACNAVLTELFDHPHLAHIKLEENLKALRHACDRGLSQTCDVWFAMLTGDGFGVPKDLKRIRAVVTPRCEKLKERSSCKLLGLLRLVEHKARDASAPRVRADEARTAHLLHQGCDAKLPAHKCHHVAQYQLFLAKRYKTPEDIKRAREHLVGVSAVSDHWRVELAVEMTRGVLVKQDIPGGLASLETLCQEREVTPACVALAHMYRRGEVGLKKDVARAMTLYDRACQRGHTIGCFQLVRLHRLGCGTTRDWRIAAFYANKLCDERTCSGARRGGCFLAGQLYMRGGWKLDQNLALAEQRYQYACGLGDYASCNNLGVQAREGNLGAERRAEGCPLMERSCGLGGALGCVNYGNCLEFGGEGLKPDLRLARAFYERGCKMGQRVGCLRVARMEESGKLGNTSDVGKARAVYEAQCTAKHHDGCMDLARLSEQGAASLPKDPDRAVWWRARACVLAGMHNACYQWAQTIERAGRADEAVDVYEFACEKLGQDSMCRERDALRKRTDASRKPVVLPPAPTTGGVGADGAPEIQKAMQARLDRGMCGDL